jgi:hypothetical protein
VLGGRVVHRLAEAVQNAAGVVVKTRNELFPDDFAEFQNGFRGAGMYSNFQNAYTTIFEALRYVNDLGLQGRRLELGDMMITGCTERGNLAIGIRRS